MHIQDLRAENEIYLIQLISKKGKFGNARNFVHRKQIVLQMHHTSKPNKMINLKSQFFTLAGKLKEVIS